MDDGAHKKLSLEMVSFWFGPTESGKVALTSCALALSGSIPTECLGADLALGALGSGFGLDRARLRWTQPKPDENAGWARLRHRRVFVEGQEAFGLNFAFMDRFERAARVAGTPVWRAPAYWANFEACLADWELWPHPEARAWIERAALDHEEASGGAGGESSGSGSGTGDAQLAGSVVRSSQGTRRL